MGAENIASKTLFDQQRQATAVVNVGMRYENQIDIAGGKRKNDLFVLSRFPAPSTDAN
jgi:hypothetical protein